MGQMAEQLDLTPDQQEAVGRVFRSVFGRAQAGGEMDRRAMQADIETGLREVLTPDQMQRYREMRRQAAETRPGSVWVETADGRLVERRVRLGINDSQRTEIVGGDLDVGDNVVTRAREVVE